MKTVLKSSLFLLACLCLFLLTAGGKDADAGKTETVTKSETVLKLPKLVDLGAHKCIPCKKMAPMSDTHIRNFYLIATKKLDRIRNKQADER